MGGKEIPRFGTDMLPVHGSHIVDWCLSEARKNEKVWSWQADESDGHDWKPQVSSALGDLG